MNRIENINPKNLVFGIEKKAQLGSRRTKGRYYLYGYKY